MNHWALWRSSDALVTNMLGRRLGVKGLSDIFSDLSLGPHDHVWLDLTYGAWSPTAEEHPSGYNDNG